LRKKRQKSFRVGRRTANGGGGTPLKECPKLGGKIAKKKKKKKAKAPFCKIESGKGKEHNRSVRGKKGIRKKNGKVTWTKRGKRLGRPEGNGDRERGEKKKRRKKKVFGAKPQKKEGKGGFQLTGSITPNERGWMANRGQVRKEKGVPYQEKKVIRVQSFDDRGKKKQEIRRGGGGGSTG